MTTTDPAVQFWLRYVEAEGGLHEDAGDQVLAMLPEELRTALDLPEEVAVTADPEVAREDGALLLLPGHPVLDQAAASVLEQGDGGSAWLPWPEAVLPAPAALLERARERFDVDHGRIDAGGHPARVYLPVLRVGALVSYTAGLGGRFQEREEVWVDARSGLALGGSLVRTVAQAPLLEVPDASHRVLVPDLVKALAGAHASIEDRALARREALATQAQAALREERNCPCRCAAAPRPTRSRSPGCCPARASPMSAARTAAPPTGWWRVGTGSAAVPASDVPRRPPPRPRPPCRPPCQPRTRGRRLPHHLLPSHLLPDRLPARHPPSRRGDPRRPLPGRPASQAGRPRRHARQRLAWTASGSGGPPASSRPRSGRRWPAASAGRASRWRPALP